MKSDKIDSFSEEDNDKAQRANRLEPASEYKIVGNHSGYGYKGSENFEHDQNGAIHNYSGVEDYVFSSIADHEAWEENYDY